MRSSAYKMIKSIGRTVYPFFSACTRSKSIIQLSRQISGAQFGIYSMDNLPVDPVSGAAAAMYRPLAETLPSGRTNQRCKPNRAHG